MPRGKSNRGNNRDDERSNSRGGRQNVSSRRGLAATDDETQRRIASKGENASHGGRGSRISRTSEDSDRSE